MVRKVIRCSKWCGIEGRRRWNEEAAAMGGLCSRGEPIQPRQAEPVLLDEIQARDQGRSAYAAGRSLCSPAPLSQRDYLRRTPPLYLAKGTKTAGRHCGGAEAGECIVRGGGATKQSKRLPRRSGGSLWAWAFLDASELYPVLGCVLRRSPRSRASQGVPWRRRACRDVTEFLRRCCGFWRPLGGSYEEPLCVMRLGQQPIKGSLSLSQQGDTAEGGLVQRIIVPHRMHVVLLPPWPILIRTHADPPADHRQDGGGGGGGGGGCHWELGSYCPNPQCRLCRGRSPPSGVEVLEIDQARTSSVHEKALPGLPLQI
eukprot:gene16916-biopygen1249